MTNTITQELDRIQKEADEKKSKLLAAQQAVKDAEAAAALLAEEESGRERRRQIRIAIEEHFNSQMRPHHDAAFEEIMTRLQKWQERFNAVDQEFRSLKEDYVQVESDYVEAKKSAYRDAFIVMNPDNEALGVSWTQSDFSTNLAEITHQKDWDQRVADLHPALLKLLQIEERPQVAAASEYHFRSIMSRAENDNRLQPIIQAIVDKVDAERAAQQQ